MIARSDISQNIQMLAAGELRNILGCLVIWSCHAVVRKLGFYKSSIGATAALAIATNSNFTVTSQLP
jgi:hypothetical protein